jgi:hypothetical protein
MAMSITKFFRKYNKRLLAVITVGLMVVFLLPTALKDLVRPEPGKQVIAEAFGKEIRQSDLMETRKQTEVLNMLSYSLAREDSRQQRPFDWGKFVQSSRENEAVINYYLLIEEAHRMGLDIPMEQVDRELSDMKVPPELVNIILKRADIPLKYLRTAVANYLAVEGAFGITGGALKVSDAEMKYLYRMTSERMKANVAAFSADAFSDTKKVPDEKTLSTFFAEHQKQFAFPDRIEAEYIEADLNAIKETVNISKERARQEYEDKKSSFTKTTYPTTKAKNGTTTRSTQPVEVPMTEDEALPQIIERLKMKKAQELAYNALQDIKRQSSSFWQTPAGKKDEIPQKPAKVSDYKQMVDDYAKEHHVKLIYHKTPLISAEEAFRLSIGQAFIVGQENQRLSFAEYAFRLVPQLMPVPQDKKNQDLLYLVLYQDCRDLLRKMEPDGSPTGYFLFRVVKVDPKRLPNSLDEVKDKVITDYQLNEGFNVAQTKAEKLKLEAAKVKLNEVMTSKKPTNVFKLLEQAKIIKLEPQNFARRDFGYGGRLSPPYIDGVKGDSQVVAEQAFDKLWNQPTTQPDGVFTSAVICDNTTRTCYVVQLVEKEQASLERFQQIQPMMVRYLTYIKNSELARNWFNPENLHKRTKFRMLITSEEEAY